MHVKFQLVYVIYKLNISTLQEEPTLFLAILQLSFVCY